MTAAPTTVTHVSNGQLYTYAGLYSNHATARGRNYPGYVEMVSESGKVVRIRADRVMVLAPTATAPEPDSFPGGPF